MGTAVAKYHKENSTSYALGATVVFELINRHPESVRKIYLSTKLDNEIENKLKLKCERLNAEFIISDKAINILSAKENCFVVAEFEKIEYKLENKNSHIMLVHPSNCGNLGTIIRSAVGFNVPNIAIITPSCDVFDPKTIRASMGSVFSAGIECFSSFSDYEKRFNCRDFYPFMLQTNNDLRNSDISNKENVTLIFGNEATGLEESFLKVGTPLRIFHNKGIDSLNIQTAVSLALYELTKNKKF